MINKHISLEELARLGREFYFKELQDVLEKDFMGQFAVLDVEQKKYTVDPNQLEAIKKARKEFGEKLFYIVQIGDFRRPAGNFSPERYAWHF